MPPARTVRAKIKALESGLFALLRERWRRSLLLQDDPHPGIDWVENTQEIQTLVFYCQLLPIIFRCVEYCPSSPARIADVGAATGAGGDLVSKMLTNLMGQSVETTCFDTSPYFERLAIEKYPVIRYRRGDFLEYQEQFDLAICSHMIEHVPNPRSFVGKVMEKLDYFLIGYVPFMEVNLIPGHINSFDETSIAGMPGLIWARIIQSVGWRSASEEHPRCAAFVCATARATEVVDIEKLCALLDEEFHTFAIRPTG